MPDKYKDYAVSADAIEVFAEHAKSRRQLLLLLLVAIRAIRAYEQNKKLPPASDLAGVLFA